MYILSYVLKYGATLYSFDILGQFFQNSIQQEGIECFPIQEQLENQYFRKKLSVFPANSQSESFPFIIAVILSLFLCLEQRGKFDKFSVQFCILQAGQIFNNKFGFRENQERENKICFESPFSRQEFNVSLANSSLRINLSGMNQLSSQPKAKGKPVAFSQQSFCPCFFVSC